MLTFTKKGDDEYEVATKSEFVLGDILRDNDGFFYFWPIQKGGFWDGGMMMEIARKLEALNEAWKQHINKSL